MHFIPAFLSSTGNVVAEFDLEALMQTGIKSVETSLFMALTIVVPTLISVIAAVTAVKFGIRWLKKLGSAT